MSSEDALVAGLRSIVEYQKDCTMQILKMMEMQDEATSVIINILRTTHPEEYTAAMVEYNKQRLENDARRDLEARSKKRVGVTREFFEELFGEKKPPPDLQED